MHLEQIHPWISTVQLNLHIHPFIEHCFLLLEGTRRLDMTTNMESAWTRST